METDGVNFMQLPRNSVVIGFCNCVNEPVSLIKVTFLSSITKWKGVYASVLKSGVVRTGGCLSAEVNQKWTFGGSFLSHRKCSVFEAQKGQFWVCWWCCSSSCEAVVDFGYGTPCVMFSARRLSVWWYVKPVLCFSNTCYTALNSCYFLTYFGIQGPVFLDRFTHLLQHLITFT